MKVVLALLALCVVAVYAAEETSFKTNGGSTQSADGITFKEVVAGTGASRQQHVSSVHEDAKEVLTVFEGTIYQFDVSLDVIASTKFLRLFGFPNGGPEPVKPPTSGPTFNFFGSHTAYGANWNLNRVVLASASYGIISPAFDNPFTTPTAEWAYASGSRWPSDIRTTVNSLPNPNEGNAFNFLFAEVTANFHGVIDFRVENEPTPDNPTDGDPQFSGLQGQYFQFHGMADEVFSLVSSPDLQMNSLFKFISSGSCEYNNTVCWTHPGTYLGEIGIQFGSNKILLKSGSHSAGMKVFINDREIHASQETRRLRNKNATALISYEKKDTFNVYTDLMVIRIVNSDYFFNLDFGLKDQSILIAGSPALQINGEICERESRVHKSELATTGSQIKKQLASTYPSVPLHGLIGQTWRNAIYCGRYFEGSVDDYVTGGLFSNEHTFNFFNQL